MKHNIAFDMTRTIGKIFKRSCGWSHTKCKKYTNFKTTKKLTGKILGNSRTDNPLVVTYNPKIFFKSCNLCKSQNHFQNYEALFAIFQFMNSEKKMLKIFWSTHWPGKLKLVQRNPQVKWNQVCLKYNPGPKMGQQFGLKLYKEIYRETP